MAQSPQASTVTIKAAHRRTRIAFYLAFATYHPYCSRLGLFLAGKANAALLAARRWCSSSGSGRFGYASTSKGCASKLARTAEQVAATHEAMAEQGSAPRSLDMSDWFG